ncbi:hypothetical protein [Pseudoduganella flava]|uniref:Uncharacterized protein n=1 Tax=Pseudoduganella flava TaxID=871742 RepID=A0ABX6FU44_9BURK|nr:hypothetical protein [Pseudoduganella flava]QGZ41030.1 hypothetical protein GO485_19455 [Pseudoduganella flava]
MRTWPFPRKRRPPTATRRRHERAFSDRRLEGTQTVIVTVQGDPPSGWVAQFFPRDIRFKEECTRFDAWIGGDRMPYMLCPIGQSRVNGAAR